MCVSSMWMTSYNIFRSFGALARSWEGWLRQKSSRDASIAPGECKIAPRGSKITPGGFQNRPWGCPAKVPKNRSPNKRSRAGKCIANGSNNKTPNRNVGGTIGDIFQFVPASFLGWICNGSFEGCWIDLCINFMLYLDVFEYAFEASWFG